MIKKLLLLCTWLLAAVALITFFPAPDQVWAWKAALIVGEYGHYFLMLPLILTALAFLNTRGVHRLAVLAGCVVIVVGLLHPVVSAQRLAAGLPAALDRAFGAADSAGPVLSWEKLYTPPPLPAVKMTTEVFAQPDGVELKLDFYQPVVSPGGKTPPACLVVIHGGGWDSGDRTQLSGWNRRWAARGYAVAAISYRLAPASVWPAQRDDVLAAVAWLKAHAGRLGIDATRLVLIGRSAGGQLATAVGYGAHDPAIRGVIALYAPHDMPFAWSVSREDDTLNSIKLFRQYFGGAPDSAARQAAYAAASGQLLAQAGSPPTLLIHGETDTLAWCRHSERLAARLAELHVPHYYLRLPWATHGFDYNPDGPGGQLADYAISRFLAAVTR